jgi:hypothetical protein
MKHLVLFLIAGIFVFGSISCNKGGSSPGDVVITVNKLMSEGEFDKIPDYMATKDGALTEEESGKVVSLYTMSAGEIKNKKGIKKTEILKEEIAEDGNSARVEYKVIFGDDSEEEETQELINVDGKWKLLFSGNGY